jgi:hypothetical protein
MELVKPFRDSPHRGGPSACVRSPRLHCGADTVVLLLLLPFLALGRRGLLEFTGWQSYGPALARRARGPASSSSGCSSSSSGRSRRRTSKLVLVVMARDLAGVNPRGGRDRRSGRAVVLVVPLCWYFIGRELMSPRWMRILFGGLVVVASRIALRPESVTHGLPGWDLGGSAGGYGALVGEVAAGTFSGSAVRVPRNRHRRCNCVRAGTAAQFLPRCLYSPSRSFTPRFEEPSS